MIENTDTVERVKHESKKKEIAGFMILIVSLILIGFGASGWQGDLTLESVAVEGNSVVPAGEIVALSKVENGSKLAAIELTKIRDRVLHNAFIKDVTVRREFPGTIIVSVVERKPVALINAGELVGCDAEGMILPHIVSPGIADLPVISGRNDAGRLQPGCAVNNSEIREALAVLVTAADIDSAVFRLISEIRLLSGGEFMLYTTDCGVPVMIGRGRIAEKIALLSSFWKEVVRTGSAGRFGSIDIRFKDQVVVRWAGNVRTSTQPG